MQLMTIMGFNDLLENFGLNSRPIAVPTEWSFELASHLSLLLCVSYNASRVGFPILSELTFSGLEVIY